MEKLIELSWQRYKSNLYVDPELDLMLDISRMIFSNDFFDQMTPQMKNIYTQIDQLEKGAIANPDENRRVGHYWLRNSEIAPSIEISNAIQENIKNIKVFAEQIHSGEICTEKGERFRNILLIGIGGSCLGPQFVSNALGTNNDQMSFFSIDNTDPDGMDRIFARLEQELDATLCIVISKSGGTLETRNGMLEAKNRYQTHGLSFSKHAVSITQEGSKLYQTSQDEGWIRSFPMWDWVGGRTSVFSSVGLVGLALQGIDIDSLLEGGRLCDIKTREANTSKNPAALLALMWYKATEGKGGKQMVMLPYKDRLVLFSKYLQQLLMESLGKEKDLEGNIVHQGLTVFGNKGATDQHSYVQQLLEGPDNFFVTFIEVLKDRNLPSPILTDNSTSGDYLQASLLGTRSALSMKGRESITITISDVTPSSIGVLISLFERAVSIYALLVNVNAYHQPAVEMGKTSTGKAIDLKNRVLDFLNANRGQKYTIEELVQQLHCIDDEEILFKLLIHLRTNPDHSVKVLKSGESIFVDRYYIE
ncbi:glucose-6-phosphate isomerase [Desulfitobacterium sp.]|uniref:glucose-6-phosphate isomerase n=1 Tax=Desulfitobacterium sp. TaxID=49981 RepID=UPI002B1FAE9C|nr:glucose-6-phosphate isomerase [Desulfitobacterium sp.]MEA4903169.1 glucose-6-phosphate isomerase [Desulfitobacterium sp.]